MYPKCRIPLQFQQQHICLFFLIEKRVLVSIQSYKEKTKNSPLCYVTRGHCRYSRELELFNFASVLNKDSPGGSDGKESSCNAGDIKDVGSIPGLERSPGEGNGK